MTTIQQKLAAAITAHQSGNIDAATQLYRDILAQQPDQADALHMLGIIAQQKGNSELALKLVEAALAKQPDMALAWCNRCLILRVLNRHDEALESAWQAIRVDPNLADGYDMAGTILRAQNHYDEACRLLKQAVTLQPDNIRFQSNYAALLLATHDLANAYRAVRETEKLDPQFVPFTLANVLKAAGYPERAIPHFHKSFDLLPHYRDAKVNEAMAYLQIGELEKGWSLWERRPDMSTPYHVLPLWNGVPVKHLLIYEDQGLGDVIQCLRYISLLRGLAEKITLHVVKPLQKLSAVHFSDITVLAADEPIPQADARVRFLSLPYILKTTLDNIPVSTSYLKAEPAWRAPWQTRLAHLPKPRIGFVWGGNPANRNDHNRSLTFTQMSQLLQAGPAHFVSLQKGEQKKQADFTTAKVFDADPLLNDFTDRAGLLAELDLLISVDTATVHLAAALGKPVWLLVPFDSDWRWLMGREDSPWYPTLRVFRQTQPGKWDDVLAHVAEELQKLMAGDDRVLIPQEWNGPALRQNPYALTLPD